MISAINRLMIAMIAGAGGIVHASVQFVDVTDQLGLSLPHVASYLITGQAFADINRDGWPDIVVTSSDGNNAIWLNQHGQSFTRASFSADIAVPGHACGGLAIADYDNDGWPDIYMTGNGGNFLFRNVNGQAMVNVTALVGVAHGGRDESAAWGDFNLDGWLDLIVVGFSLADHPDPDAAVNLDALYFSLGPDAQGQVTFADVSTLLGSQQRAGPGFAVGVFDLDQDGDQDIYVVNDKLYGNTMWRNDGAGCGGWCFSDVAAATQTLRPAFSMGLAIGDIDNDLDDDLLYSSINEQVLLRSQLSQGELSYSDISAAAGVSVDAVGWSTLLFDVDNDGWLDAWIGTYNSQPQSSDRLYLNQRNGTFLDISQTSGVTDPRPTIGAASGDFNRDGQLDLLIGDHGNGYRLLENTSNAANRWLQLRLLAPYSDNRDAIGAVVTVTRGSGVQSRHRLFSGDAIGSGSERLVHVGLGAEDAVELEVLWPDGSLWHIDNPPGNQRLTLIHPDDELQQSDGFE